MSTAKLRRVSGTREEVKYYFQYNTPKIPHDKVKTLKPGQKFVGTYCGSFKNQWDKLNHRIRTEKGMIAVASSSQIDRDMAKVEEGADVEVTYTGTYIIKDGPYKGKKGHAFDVFASEFTVPPTTTRIKKNNLQVAASPSTTDTDETDDGENDPF